MRISSDPFVVNATLDNNARPVLGLTIEEAERLAKAGIKVELAGPITIDNTQEPKQIGSNDHLKEMLHDRWSMSMRAKHDATFDYRFGYVMPIISAHRYDDKVYVFACSGNAPPEIIEDDVAVYPSDALLAKLHLMVEHNK